MAPESSSSAPGPERPAGESKGADVLHRLSPRTKALVIASEFTQRQMGPGDLRLVLEALAPSPEEQRTIARAAEEELRAAHYPVSEIMRLMAEIAPAGPGAPQAESAPSPPSADPGVVVTRKVRPPSLKPFEKFEFKAQGEPAPGQAPALPQSASSDPTAAQARPGGGGALGGLRFVSGGETASFSPTKLRSLAETRAAAAGRQVVLVADDDARARMMYRAKIEESGFSVAEAKDGIEAWNQIKTGCVQCAVLDMKMPGYHGLEVLSRMVDSNLLLPVVVVSAFDQLANEFVVATYPRLKFLAKPAPPEVVAEAVSSFLRPGKRVGASA